MTDRRIHRDERTINFNMEAAVGKMKKLAPDEQTLVKALIEQDRNAMYEYIKKGDHTRLLYYMYAIEKTFGGKDEAFDDLYLWQVIVEPLINYAHVLRKKLMAKKSAREILGGAAGILEELARLQIVAKTAILNDVVADYVLLVKLIQFQCEV